MRHIRVVSRNRPSKAQFDTIVNIIGVLNAILLLYRNLAETFGIPVPQKSVEEDTTS